MGSSSEKPLGVAQQNIFLMKSSPLANISDIKKKTFTVKGYFSNLNIKTNKTKSRYFSFFKVFPHGTINVNSVNDLQVND